MWAVCVIACLRDSFEQSELRNCQELLENLESFEDRESCTTRVYANRRD